MDLETAIQGASFSIFFNHGQCCSAGSRLYIEKGVFDQVVEGVADQARKIKVGPGFDPSTQMGPLVSDEQLHRVTGYLESGISDGAKPLSGGHRYGKQGYFVEPTVLVDVNQHMKEGALNLEQAITASCRCLACREVGDRRVIVEHRPISLHSRQAIRHCLDESTPPSPLPSTLASRM